MFENFFRNEFWQNVFWGNSFRDYAISILVLIVAYLVLRIFYLVVIGQFEKAAKSTSTRADDAIIDVIKSFKPPFYIFLAFYVAFRFLNSPDYLSKIVTTVLAVWIIYQIVVSVKIIIRFAFSSHDENSESKSAVGFLGMIVDISIWSIGLLLVLSNLGVNITSLIAGLGIGGVAVAFALQNILGDLFSSFAIYFDKPFVVGDFVIVGDKMGVVKKIGIKTTRIQALQGEELVFGNKEITSSTIQNFKQMRARRVQFGFGVEYGTAPDKIKKIKIGVGQIFSEFSDLRLDRVHFKSFEDSSLFFEVVYYVDSSEYNVYMDRQESINLKLMELLKKEKVEFAFPTQTIHVKK